MLDFRIGSANAARSVQDVLNAGEDRRRPGAEALHNRDNGNRDVCCDEVVLDGSSA